MTRKLLALTLLVLTSCAFATKHDEFKKVVASAPKPAPSEVATPAPAASPTAAEATESEETEPPPAKPVVTSQPAPGLKDIGKPSDESAGDEEPAAKAESKEEAPAPVAKKAAPAEIKGVPAEQSLKWLANGNTRYVMKRFRADGRQQADRDRTKDSQHPHAIVLSCSDSRVPPELVFDQGIGEIFTIRVAGEALDSSVIASIEYAIQKLGVHLLVVMGHTNCGAVEAAMKVASGDEPESAALDKMLAEIRPHLKTRTSEKPSKNLEIESALNADGVARDLLSRSALVKERVDSGQLTIKTALYWLDSGKVKFF